MIQLFMLSLLLIAIFFGYKLYRIQAAGDVEKKNIFYAASFIATSLIFIYFLPALFPDATTPSWAGSMGQLGDYIGGVLNPILSFITIILLIRSLKSNEAFVNHEKFRAFASDIEDYLEAKKVKFDKGLTEISFNDPEITDEETGNLVPYTSFTLSNVHSRPPEWIQSYLHIRALHFKKHTQYLLKNSNKISDNIGDLDIMNLSNLREFRVLTKEVVQLTGQLVSSHHPEIINVMRLHDLNRFLWKVELSWVITQEERIQYLEFIATKLDIDLGKLQDLMKNEGL